MKSEFLIGVFLFLSLIVRSQEIQIPKHTLFVDPEFTVEEFKKRYGVNISKEFATCMDNQLTDTFIRLTGIKPGKNVSVSNANEEKFFYKTDTLSRFPIEIFINNNWNPVEVVWKSSSGRIYNMEDSVIDCKDIQFAFDKFDAELYKRQTKLTNLPFKTDNLGFNLEVQGLNVDCTVFVELKSKGPIAKKLQVNIDKWINEYNEASLKESRFNGVVHSWKTQEYGSCIIIDLDLGSTGPKFIEDLLRFFSETKAIEKIIIS